MSPQFVDFDADGHGDILAGTYDGSPYLARGSAKGYAAPTVLLDRKGERIVQNAYWDYDAKKWETTTRCNPEGDTSNDAHGTSAFAIDWDKDGDFDLLLGDYKGGRLHLRVNDGTNAKPAFAVRNAAVEAGGKPLHVEGGISTIRVCDWNADGRPDLLMGSMGDCFGAETGGGVQVFVNEGETGAPRFGAPVALVERLRKGHAEPARPDSGLYMDLADVDGDGDLDLVAGGYSHWTPAGRELDGKEKERAAELQRTVADLQKRQTEIYRQLAEATKGLKDKELQEKRAEFLRGKAAEQAEIREKHLAAQRELDQLVPSPQRVSYVWLYERIAK